jgi:oligopeptide/dipeptide ABC transporter ATP-binding protein
MSPALLELENVKTHFPAGQGGFLGRANGAVRAVDGVSLRLEEGEILGLVGESGCGKSTLARTIVQLAPATDGRVLFRGHDLRSLSRQDLRATRRSIQLIFQDPYASLNPRMTVFDTLAEPLVTQRGLARQEAAQAVGALMERVGLAPRFMKKYPHEFSGGQRQRIAIARALALDPDLILADEPVSALDVSVQAQIINLIAELCRESLLSLVFISHDLSVVRHLAHRIAVMYLGKIVEVGESDVIFNAPRHPYTRALLSAIPTPDPDKERRRKRTLLEGDLPSPLNPPTGCAFHPRCPHADAACNQRAPTLESVGGGHAAACLKLDEPQ